MGTSGPQDIDPATGEPWGLSFPVITIGDIVRAQRLLIDHLGIHTLFCLIGASMGGMQLLQWAPSFPELVFAAAPMSCAARHPAPDIASHELRRLRSML